MGTVLDLDDWDLLSDAWRTKEPQAFLNRYHKFIPECHFKLSHTDHSLLNRGHGSESSDAFLYFEGTLYVLVYVKANKVMEPWMLSRHAQWTPSWSWILGRGIGLITAKAKHGTQYLKHWKCVRTWRGKDHLLSRQCEFSSRLDCARRGSYWVSSLQSPD